MKTKGRPQSSNIEDRRPTIEKIIWADKVRSFQLDSYESARQKKTIQPYNKFSK